MEQSKRLWIDLLIILGMVILVYLLTQPFGRKWDEKTAEVYTGEEGVYALDMDTYYYLRKAREFTEGGISSIKLFSGRANDALMTPVRTDTGNKDPQLMSAVAALIWFLLRAVGIRVGIYYLCIHLCGFVLALCTIPAYLFLKKRVTRDAAAVGALFLTLAPPFFQHSVCGMFDTDAFICLLASIMIFSLFECVLSEKRKDKIIYGILACAATILLRLTWGSFYSYVIIAIGITGFSIVVGWLFLKQKRPLLIPGITAVLMALMLLSAKGSIIGRIKSMIGVGEVSESWPQASANLSEMARTKMHTSKGFWYWFMSVDSDFVSYCGGIIVLLLLILSSGLFVYRFIKRRKNKEEGSGEKDFLFLAVGSWLLGSVYLALKAVRFMEFIALPSAIAIAFGFYAARKFLMEKRQNRTLNRAFYVIGAVLIYAILMFWKPLLACIVAAVIMAYGFFGSRLKKDYGILIVLALTILASLVENTILYTSKTKPLMEKPVEEALLYIRDNTAKDAVIADFWSYGYIYQYYGERRTLADGGTYNGEYFYWLATMLTTDNPDLSAGIARMLQGSGLDGLDYARVLSGNGQKASVLLKEVLPLSKSEASELLRERYSEEQTNKLLGFTHPDSVPEMYFVLNSNIFKVSTGMLYFSNWDFTGRMDPADIAQGLFLGQQSVPRPEGEQTVECGLWRSGQENIWKAQLYSEEDAVRGTLVNSAGLAAVARRNIYVKDGVTVYDERYDVLPADKNVLDKGALVIVEEKGEISVLLCEETMPDSLLYRLLVFDGAGQDSFEKVYEGLLPAEISGEVSMTQRRLGTKSTRDYYNYGMSVWKIRTGR